MPWKECDNVSLRLEFVSLASVEGANLAALCRRFGIARKTGYKWLQRYRCDGATGLSDRSRRPRRSPQRSPGRLEQAVLAIRDVHPAWGGRKIRARLKMLGHPTAPSASTITAILRRHGRLDPAESIKHKPWQRFEHSAPNDLWQMDFKGEFRTSDRLWCYPLTILDDHSRYSLELHACANQQGVTVRDRLTAVFKMYGLPRVMLMDNGTPWGTSHVPGGWTKLTAWLLRLDVRVTHGRPYHPQTQGKEERFHRTLQAELLHGRRIDDLPHAQSLFDPWRRMYNCERPHEALKMAPPSSRYAISRRSYPEALPPLVYGSQDQARRVSRVGQFSFASRQFKISEAFGGDQIGLRPTSVDGVWDVYYAHQRLGRVDLHENPHGAKNARLLPVGSGRCAPSTDRQQRDNEAAMT